MGDRETKFCQDRNKIRWILIEGKITRSAPEDDPTAPNELPVEQINGVEKTSVQRKTRSPLAWPAIYVSLVLLAVTAWLLSMPGAARVVAVVPLILGCAALLWGLSRVKGNTELIDAYQLIVSGARKPEWLIVGSHNEVEGFIGGLRKELKNYGPNAGVAALNQ